MVLQPDVIPNSYIRIDNFAGSADIYILTHAHADHMTGLRAGWSAGPLYCSPMTAHLLRRRGIAQTVRPQPLGEPFRITNRYDHTTATITFTNANHCPGSVMAVIENLAQGTVVHTGDCRFSDDISADPVLNRVAGAVQHLYMDTSWDICWLPDKAASVRDVVALVREHEAEDIILHSHGLGDEEVLEAAAAAFPDRSFKFWNEDRLADLKVTNANLIRTLMERPLRRPCFHIVKSKAERREYNLEGVEIACSCLWFVLNNVSVRGATLDGDLWRVPFSMHSSKEEWQELRRWLAPKAMTPICPTIATCPPSDRNGGSEENQESDEEEKEEEGGEEAEELQKEADREEEARVREAIIRSVAFYREAVSPAESSDAEAEPEDTRDVLDIVANKRARLD